MNKDTPDHNAPGLDLDALLEEVNDEQSFLAFIDALRADWELERELEKEIPSPPFSAGATGWENGSIGQFLEAAVAYANDSPDDGTTNPWRRAAHIIYAGKFYE